MLHHSTWYNAHFAMCIAFSLCCLQVRAWVPLVVVPVDGRVALGPLPLISGDAMPSAETLAFMSRKDGAIVFEIICSEPKMERIVAKARMHDEAQVWKDDCIELFLQPKGCDKYIHVAVNSLGTIFDELGGDTTWDGSGIKAKCSCGINQWTATVAIPFADLRETPVSGDEWRINVCRSRNAVRELSAWSATGGAFHNPSGFGVVRFSSEPWPKSFAWHISQRDSGRVILSWEKGNEVAVTLDGKTLHADGAFSFSPLKDNILHLEGKVGEATVFRATLPIPADPIMQFIQSASAALKGLDSPLATAIRTKLNAIDELIAGACPEEKAPFMDVLADLAAQARNVRAVAAFTAKGRSAREIPYGVESSLVKLLRHDPFNGEIGGVVSLDAARNEMDCAQIVLFAGASDVVSVKVGPDYDLKSDGGEVLPASALRLRRVNYVMTEKPAYKVGYVGLWPDPLVELSPFDIHAYSFETLWIDVRVPNGQKPGRYTGSITFVAINGMPTRIPVEVRVRNFTIPRRSSLTTAFGMAPHTIEKDFGKVFGKQIWATYLDNLLEHRITPYNACTNRPTLISLPAWNWNGAKCLVATVIPSDDAAFHTSLTMRDGKVIELPHRQIHGGETTKIEFPEDAITGAVASVKFTAVGAASAKLGAEIVFADGLTRELDITPEMRTAKVSSDWIKEWPTWRIDAFRHPDTPAVFDWAAFDSEFEEVLARGITSHCAPLGKPVSAWSLEDQRHFVEKGWQQYFYTYRFDEPTPKDYPRINEDLAQIKESGPCPLRNMVTARSFPPELLFVDIWCPELFSFDPKLSAAEQKKGREVWWYTAFSTQHPLPNYWIEYPALDCRILPWLTWKHDIDGILYWQTTCWWKNPWESAAVFDGCNGDGSLFYPGTDGRPVDSIRWECIRDGMEDYEVFCLLEAAARELDGRRSELKDKISHLCAIDDSVVADWRNFSSDPRVLLDARRQMSDCLEEAVAALGHEPTIKGRPRHRPGVSPQEVRSAIAKLEADAAKSAPVVFSSPAAEPMDSLCLEYRFDTELPFVFDYSGNGRHASPISAKRVKGPTGKALQLTGKGYLPLPAGEELFGQQPKEGSIEFMVRPDFDPASLASAKGDKRYACLFCLMKTSGNWLPDGKDEIGLFINGDNLDFRLGGSDMLVGRISPVPFLQGKWHRVSMVWEPGDRRLYIDGKLAIRNTLPYSPPRLDAFNGTLGVHPTRKALPFKGTFDNLRIWSRAHPKSEHQEP